MSIQNIHVFISHSWKYSKQYDKLAAWIFDEKWTVGNVTLRFANYSVPRDNPIHNAPNDLILRDAIYRKISRCHVIVIPTGMYANYSKWIKKEIEGSYKYKKPILAVNPWGQQRISSVVSSNSKKIVGWNQNSVVSGIWELYRQ